MWIIYISMGVNDSIFTVKLLASWRGSERVENRPAWHSVVACRLRMSISLPNLTRNGTCFIDLSPLAISFLWNKTGDRPSPIINRFRHERIMIFQPRFLFERTFISPSPRFHNVCLLNWFWFYLTFKFVTV